MKVFNVASNKLDKDSARYLAEFIKDTPGLTTVKVADNKFGESGACAIILALDSCKNTYVALMTTIIVIMMMILTNLASDPFLHSLDTLDLTNIKMGPKAITLLKDFLSGTNRVSTYVILSSFGT